MDQIKIKYQGVSTLEVLKDAKNYNNWIASEVIKNVSAPVMEIGAGTGNLSKYFASLNPFHITEIDKGLVTQLKNIFSSNKNIFVHELDISQIIPKKFWGYFSTIFAVNVLEHIEDDEKTLKNIKQMLKNKGKLVLLVPAKKFAYTKLDKELGHFRRYEKDELKKKLVNAGYKIEKLYFFNIVGLLSWYIRDKVNRGSNNMKPYQIRIFDMIVPLLKLFESKIKIPVGISLIAVARKI